MKILNVVGARPNFMKIAPLMAEYSRHENIHAILVHTGQHYDDIMSDLFFSELGIPKPDINLEVGSGSHAVQTAEIMKRFEPVLINHKPDVVVVVGDVNSTIACGLVAVQLGAKLAHVEAGLRSFDRSMPEEINRVLTDSISDFLFCTEQSGVDNLIREGIPQEKVHFVGNVMIDTLLKNRGKAQGSTILDRLALNDNKYALLTLHRPANVDDQQVFGHILDGIDFILKDMPVIFPIHPRTRKNLYSTALGKRVDNMAELRLMDPLGYLDFLRLMTSAAVVLTDSGGIQEETTILKVPCLTLRENTERPVTVKCGSNQIVGRNPQRMIAAYKEAVNTNSERYLTPPLWDGRATERIVRILLEEL
ncbi:MAG TPA: UDP-N-acetylglucosamine 2-epimerase (non-hydrolyzing) [Sedimentisphaerales bacterium]|nr:UDP-N-acetylglucosamine 2-epimerase (non-hydrolyzing) [Sedimentisphaerales bacterium]